MSELVSKESFIKRAEAHHDWPKIKNIINDRPIEHAIYGAVAELALEQDFRTSFYNIPFPEIQGTGIGYISDHPDISYTVRGGLVNIRTIDKLWQKYQSPRNGIYRVLDFGCGSGRLLRFPCEFGKDIQISGCEVNHKAVEWLKRAYPCDIHLMSSKQDLSFLHENMDLIYAWSIFTHFSEPEHKHWLKVLMDKLNPGGVLIATFKSTKMLERIETDASYRQKSRAETIDMHDMGKQAGSGFAYFECYDHANSTEHGIDATTFGQAYISHEYIQKEWGKFGEVAAIDIAVPEWQDIVVLKKR